MPSIYTTPGESKALATRMSKQLCEDIATCNNHDDEDWSYLPVSSNGAWIVQVRDEDGYLLGYL